MQQDTIPTASETQITVSKTYELRAKSIMIHDLNQEISPHNIQKDPPMPYVKLLLHGTDNLISSYFKLWENKDEKNYIYIFLDDVEHKLNIRKKDFMKHIIDLCDHGLLSWKKENDEIQIEMVGWSDGSNDQQ